MVIINRKIRVGLVGCGRISQNHLEAIKALRNDLELTDLCDVDISRATSKSQEFSRVNKYDDFEEFIKSTNADLVIITSPSGLHAKQSVKCAEFGKHVVTEKPMATTWSDGLNMIQVFEERKLKLFIVKQNRLNPTIVKLKELIASGLLGKLYSIHINVFWNRPQSYYDADSWRGTWALDGGALMNQASHYVDFLRWMFGPVSEVSCFTKTLARKIEAEDSGVAIFRFENESLGSLSVSMLTYPKNIEGSVMILAEKGTVKIGGVALNKVEFLALENGEQFTSEFNNLDYEITSVYGSGHLNYYKNVVDVLRGQAEALVDGPEGLKTLELLVAMYKSSAENVIIRLPLAKGESS